MSHSFLVLALLAGCGWLPALAMENGGLEKGLDQWEVRSSPSASAEVTKEAASIGESGLRLKILSQPASCEVTSPKVPVVAGKAYRAGLWSGGGGASASIEMVFFDEDGTALPAGQSPAGKKARTAVTCGTGWCPMELAVIAPEAARTAAVRIKPMAGSPGSAVDFDDFRIEEIPGVVFEYSGGRLDLMKSIAAGLDYQARLLAAKLGLPTASWRHAEAFFRKLCAAFVSLDASLLEINPLVLTKDGTLVALDAKMTFDDNALFRHKDVTALRDEAEEEPAETRAAAAGLSYVKLNGTIGCLVNGAGLAMSTMDLVKYHGGQPANFLDVGGGADVNQVTEAFRIILSDPHVKAILVNIFGGIMRCTTIANAVVEASKTVGFTVPLVVRLEGTEVEEGKKILANSGTAIITADGLTDAAKKVVAAANAA